MQPFLFFRSRSHLAEDAAVLLLHLLVLFARAAGAASSSCNTSKLPAHAMYLPDGTGACGWVCNTGYYLYNDALVCSPCAAPPPGADFAGIYGLTVFSTHIVCVRSGRAC